MMRRLRVSAACPRDATRTRMTGFNLFTQEMQEKRNVLQSPTLKEGKKNMRIMSSMWAELTQSRRDFYNRRARQREALNLSDPRKKNNNFNLLMRLFSGENNLLNAGDEAFTALIAKSTLQAMREKDTRRLRAKLQVGDDAFDSTKKKSCSITSAFKRFANPHMMFFDSFTEMQRSIAPTRQSAFSAISKLVSLSNVTESGEEYIVKNFNSLTPAESHLFAPISDCEAPFFEVFCATRCGSFDYKHFNILELFTAFRGIDVGATPDPARECVYRCLLGSDRSHDGAYYRARRCLERLETLRSSDCSLFIAKHNPVKTTVAPATYGIDAAWDDVSVATLLAETRHEQSVYDDILVRAAVLRPAEKNAQLDIYQVRLDKVDARLQAQIREDRTKQVVKSAVMTKKAKLVETKVITAEGVAVGDALKGAAPLLQLKKKGKTKAAAARKATAEATASTTATATSKTTAAKALSRSASLAKEKLSRRVTAMNTAARKKKSVKSSPARSKVAEQRRATEVEEIEANEVGECSPTEEEEMNSDIVIASTKRTSFSTAMKGKGKPQKEMSHWQPSSTAIDNNTDYFGAEERVADDVQSGLKDSFEGAAEAHEVEGTGEFSVAVPSTGKVKAEKRRTARSKLTDLKAMLPAKVRVGKLITKHASMRQKKIVPITKPQPSPYVPPKRNVDFAANIRALLSGSL